MKRRIKQKKRALKSGRILGNLNICKSEAKVVIKGQIKKRWQNELKNGSKGRYMFNNKQLVGSAGSSG